MNQSVTEVKVDVKKEHYEASIKPWGTAGLTK